MGYNYIDNWFSNFKDIGFDIIDDYNIHYRTVENYYQAAKTLDRDKRIEISLLPANKSKRAGKKLELRSNWDIIKIDIMEQALRQKFIKGSIWYKKLIDTGDESIIELNNWRDTFWGYDINLNRGRNQLGILLMKLRKEYINESIINL